MSRPPFPLTAPLLSAKVPAILLPSEGGNRMSRLSIRSWLEPFPSSEGIAIVFDVFRCSTTIHCLKSLGHGPVYVAPSLQQAEADPRTKEMRIFSELSQKISCLERFDNSPQQALGSPWETGLPALVATTTGTPAMFAAREFERVYVGSLVNFSALVAALAHYQGPVTLIPAAFPEAQHVEDEIACQAMATALEGFAIMPEFVRQCAEQARDRILASPRPAHLSGKIPTGAEDVRVALEVDRFSQVLALEFEPGANSLFAEVRKEV
jgi:phosphosulfolactate phosphohydrolase-like enzyme